MQNKSTTEKMMFCLLVCDAATTLLSDNIFMDSTHLKLPSAQNAASLNNISIIGYVPVTPNVANVPSEDLGQPDA